MVSRLKDLSIRSAKKTSGTDTALSLNRYCTL
jgi:hypothetical protein